VLLFAPYLVRDAQGGDIVLWIPLKSGGYKERCADFPEQGICLNQMCSPYMPITGRGSLRILSNFSLSLTFSLEQNGKRDQGTMLNVSKELPSQSGEFIG